ncbi:MAG: glycosyltransferase family 39 protein [Bacteroidales bacterium]|nr:glycosyltransferase family 39 protein [Bacteroidales bacterium]
MLKRIFQNDYFLIALISALFFIPFIGRMHLFDWDEINFAECAREMIVSKDYLSVQINFRPFWEKPPLFIWMQLLSMKAFGINEFAARFPNAVAGIVTLLVLFTVGKKVENRQLGRLWVLVYAASILPQMYFRSGIIDPWFNLFIFLSSWNFIRYSLDSDTSGNRMKYAALSGFFIGLAVLTKGPTGLLILGLVIFSFLVIKGISFYRGKSNSLLPGFKWSHLLVFILITSLTGGSWFILQILDGHADMVWKFILYQIRLFTIPDAGHGGHWSYHFWVLLLGVFPASVFAFYSFRVKKDEGVQLQHFHRVMLILFWVVLILFSIVKTKIVHYSSLCYYPLSFMAAYGIYRMLNGSLQPGKLIKISLSVIASIVAIVAIALPFTMMQKQKIIDSGMIKDDFAVANLGANVHWTGWESLIGIIFLAGIISGIIFMKTQIRKGILTILISSMLFTYAAILVFPYRIEKYSQRAAIDFFIKRAGEDCYVLNAGYFSYAPLFYAKIQPENIKRPMWLLTGNIDKPFYLVVKEPEYKKWKHVIPAMKELYRENGFVFLYRADKVELYIPLFDQI